MQGCFASFLSFVLQLSAFVCSGLQKLLLQNNQLSRLPEDLNSLKQLQEVLVDGNPMTDPPIEVCSQGTSAILQYLWQKRHKKAKASKVGVLKQPQCTLCMHKAVLLVIRDTLEQPTGHSATHQPPALSSDRGIVTVPKLKVGPASLGTA